MVEPTIFLMEKLSFSLKLFSGDFYGQSFIKTVRGPYMSLSHLPRLYARRQNNIINEGIGMYVSAYNIFITWRHA